MSDPYFENVVLLLQGTGLNGTTTFTDSSNQHHSITRYGQTQMSNAQSLFGQNVIEFDGDKDLFVLPASSSWQMNVSQPFTIECWFYLQDSTLTNDNQNYLLNVLNSEITPRDYGWFFRVNAAASRKLEFDIYQLEASPFTRQTLLSTAIVSLDAWHHAAISYDGTTFYLGLDGAIDSLTRTITAFSTTTSALYIASDQYGIDYNYNCIDGFMQDIRITKGIARYTSTYTPPTALFPTAGLVPTIPKFRVVPVYQNGSHSYRHL